MKTALANSLRLLNMSTAIPDGNEEIYLAGRDFVFSGSGVCLRREQRGQSFALRHDASGFRGDETRGHRRRNSRSHVRQADHFLGIVSNAWAQANPVTRPSAGVLLVLDFEKNGHYSGGTMRADQAVAFVERIRQRTGVYPGIYGSEYYLRQALNSPKVSAAQKQTLTNCWLWIANYHKEPRATAPWNYWALWQYCGDGKCGLPRSAYPISVANVRKAERNIFRGTQSDLQDFWQRRAWQPTGGKPRRESERPLTAEL